MWFSVRTMWLLASLLAVVVLVAPRGHAQSPSLPVVPGAFGYGMDTRAAYGGGSLPTIYRVTSVLDDTTVTTLNADGTRSGTLRGAMQASGPRVVIFERSGTITLRSAIVVRTPFLTVAGQTAPSPGITLKNYGIILNTNNVLIQHIRVRKGFTQALNNCGNVFELWQVNAHNIVLDHVSGSWGQDENFNFYRPSGLMNATLWRSISSEGLAYAGAGCGGGGAAPGHGMLISPDTKNVAVIQNLFAHNAQRNIYGIGGTETYVANNVIYNWADGGATLFTNNGESSGVIKASVIGNYYKTGTNTDGQLRAYPTSSAVAVRNMPVGSQIYRSDLTRVNGPGPSFAEFLNIEGFNPTVGTAPMRVPGYTPMSAAETYGSVLAQAGARPLDRDAVDVRIVREVTSRTGQILRNPWQDSVGGWPTLAVNTRRLTLPSTPHGVTASGYTNLEVWLHAYSRAVEGTSTSSPSTNSQTTTPRGPTNVRVMN